LELKKKSIFQPRSGLKNFDFPLSKHKRGRQSVILIKECAGDAVIWSLEKGPTKRRSGRNGKD
jgi:hypothetical protein